MKKIIFLFLLLIIFIFGCNSSLKAQIFSEAQITFSEDGKRLSDMIYAKFKPVDLIEIPSNKKIVDGSFISNKFPDVQKTIFEFCKSWQFGFQDLKIRKAIPTAKDEDTLFIDNNGEIKKLPNLARVFIINFPKQVDIETIILELNKHLEVEYAHGPVQLVNCAEYPNDTHYTNGDQWYLNAISAPEAWGILKGSTEIKVALIESSGVELTHSDLQSKIVGGDNNPAGVIDGHGTRVAGFAGAITNNSSGISSLGWNISLLTYQPNNDDENLTVIAQKIKDAADAGAHVINLSFKTIMIVTDCNALPKNNNDNNPTLVPSYYVNWNYPLVRNAITYAVGKNSVVVAAAGNSTLLGDILPCEEIPYPIYPAQYSNVIAVSGSQQNNTFVDEWNYGSFVDVNAPGRTNSSTGLWSTDLSNSYTNSVSKTSGTSFATPQVSALAGLIKSINSSFTPSQVQSIMENTADKIGQYLYTNGRNNYFGFGRINAHQALLEALYQIALENKSISSQSTAYNGQRKLYRELSSGKLHEVFASGTVDGGEVFYRNSTDGGSNWSVTKRLSDGTATNLAPCITMGAGSTVIVAWQKKNGSNYNVVFSRSTSGGTAWSSISTLQSNFSCASPGPLPSVAANTNTGDVIVVYRTSSGLRYVRSNSNLATWYSPVTVSGTNGSYNSPSTSFYPIASPVADKCNLAYATNTGYTSQLHYKYYSFEPGSWSGSTNLSSVLPGSYTEYKNPSLATSTNSTSTVHVAWEASLVPPPGPVIVHRKGSSGNFGSQYYVVQSQSATNPSISGLTSDNAWMVFRNSTSGGILKMKYYYSGGSWTWGSPSSVSSGNYPQLSVGSSTAKYLWTSGSSSPYTISIGSEILSKEEVLASEYSRELNFIVPSEIANETGSSITVEVKQPQIVYKDGTVYLIPFVDAPPDSVVIGTNEILKYGNTQAFVLPTDIDSLKFRFAIRMTKGENIIQDGAGSLSFDIYDVSSGNLLDGVSNQSLTADTKSDNLYQVNLTAAGIRNISNGKEISIRPSIAGLKNNTSEVIASLGHIYRFKSDELEIPKDLVETTAPREYLLEQNYPNPFNPSTVINYQIPRDGYVTLKVFDLLGNEVKTLVKEQKSTGSYRASFDATELSSGIYIYRLQVNDFVSSRKMIVLK